MKRVLWLLAAVVLLSGAGVVWFWTGEPPAVPAVRLAEGSFEDQVTTNGKAEPLEWASARAEREGLVAGVAVRQGQSVAKGAVLAVMDTREARGELASAQARIEETEAALKQLEGGGRQREIVEIDQGLRQRALEIAQTEKDLAAVERLVARNAAPAVEATQMRDRLAALRLQAAALEARKPALVAAADLAAARARLREAQAAAEAARRRIELGTVRAPLSGVVYQLEARVGAYLSPGALVANIGQTGTLKVLVYVDEPELGRVHQSMPVKITWDALDNRSWAGIVERTPTQVVPLGTRQVGEVECRIANEQGDLLPGTNVNVRILTKKADSVLLTPKEAIRRKEGITGVYVIENGQLGWRPVTLGAGNVTSVVVTSGLRAGEVVALGPETNLKAGTKVKISLP